MGISSDQTDLAFSGIVGPETGPGKFTGPVLLDQTGPGETTAQVKLHPSLLNAVHTATNATLFLQILVMVNFGPP